MRLSTGAALTGRVLDSVTGEPVDGVCPTLLSACDQDGVPGVRFTCSDGDGVYTVSAVPRGEYVLRLDPNVDSAHAGIWYQQAADTNQATRLRLQPGRTLALEDTRLDQRVLVTGRVTDSDGNPVSGAYVDLEGAYGGRGGGCNTTCCAETDADGYYWVMAPPGEYVPIAWAPYWAGQAPVWFGGAASKAAGTTLVVSSDQPTTADLTMSAGSQITGSVVRDRNQPLSDYYVGTIYTVTGDYVGDFDAWDYSDWSFTSTRLLPGDYVIEVRGVNSGTTTWYEGAKQRKRATVVTVQPGEDLPLTILVP